MITAKSVRSYDEFVKDVIAEASLRRWIRRRGDAFVLASSQYSLPIMCACCGASQATHRVERDVTARTLKLTGGVYAGFNKIAGRLPVCERCCTAHEMAHEAGVRARARIRSSQPVRRMALQVGIAAALWLLLVAAMAWPWWAWLTGVLPAAGVAGLLGWAASLDRRLAMDVREEISKTVPDGWDNPGLLNFPHVNLHYRTANGKSTGTNIHFGIYLELYNKRFADAFRAINERRVLEHRPC